MVSFDLIQKGAAGDWEAKEKIVEENIGLIYMVANKFKNRSTEKEDLFQLAAIGLLKAMNNFNPSLGLQFSTYAVPLMMGEIRRFLRDNGPVHISRSCKELASKATILRESLVKETGQEPTITELAGKLSVTPEDISVALSAMQPPASLEEPLGDSNRTLSEQIPDENKEADMINKLALMQAIKTLSKREQKIILWRYFRNKTQSEIASHLGISQVHVSRLEKQIIMKIRKIIC